MHFEIQLQHDLPREIDELMRMDVLGNFRLGKSIFERIIDDFNKEGAIIPWPVVAEYLRFLYDQGNFVALDTAIDRFLAKREDAGGEQQALTSKQIQLLQVLQAVTYTNKYGATEANLRNAQRRESSAFENLVLSNMTNLTEDEVWLLVLKTRVNYIAHEYRESLPQSCFALPWSETSDEDALCPWVAHLLAEGRFWAAQDVLEVCFRWSGIMPYKYRLDLRALWNVISAFVQLDTAADEAPLLAKMAVLQVYLAGLVRRDFNISELHYWKDARDGITSTEQSLLKILGENVWKTSRPRLRLQLLDVDMDIVDALRSGQNSFNTTNCQHRLEATMKQAESNEDLSLYEAAKFRLAVLMHVVDPNDTYSYPSLIWSFPRALYVSWREKSLENLSKQGYESPIALAKGLRTQSAEIVQSYPPLDRATSPDRTPG